MGTLGRRWTRIRRNARASEPGWGTCTSWNAPRKVQATHRTERCPVATDTHMTECQRSRHGHAGVRISGNAGPARSTHKTERLGKKVSSPSLRITPGDGVNTLSNDVCSCRPSGAVAHSYRRTHSKQVRTAMQSGSDMSLGTKITYFALGLDCINEVASRSISAMNLRNSTGATGPA